MPVKIVGGERREAQKFVGKEIENLQVSPNVVRWAELDEAWVEYLAREIAANGQQDPVLVRKLPNGRAELVAGRHRRAAILKINSNIVEYGVKEPLVLNAEFKELTDEEALRASFNENNGLPTTCMDLAYTVTRLLNLDWTVAKVASSLSTPHQKITAGRVSQLRALIRLPHSVQVALHKGALPESAARAMLRLETDGVEIGELALQVAAGTLKSADLTSRANAARRAKGKKVKRTIADLLRFLKSLDTAPAVDLKSWLDGEPMITEERLIEVFADVDVRAAAKAA